MTMPVGPAVGTTLPRPGLDSAFQELLAVTRAQSVRLISLADGCLLAARAARPVPVDAAADLALARLVTAAFAAAAADGGFGDLVLAGRGATHVLAPAPYGSVLVVRLGAGADVGRARRAVLAPTLLAALRAGHPAAPDMGRDVARPSRRAGRPVVADTGPMRPVLAIPAPRAPEPSDPDERQPALAALDAAPFTARTGELAARALGDLGAAALIGVPAAAPQPLVNVPLPRRSGRGHLRDEGVLATAWNHDVAVMRRVLEGLRRLA